MLGQDRRASGTIIAICAVCLLSFALPFLGTDLSKAQQPEASQLAKSDPWTVTLEVAVTKSGGTGEYHRIAPSYFRILEDGVPQTITGYRVPERIKPDETRTSPITVALVIEWSGLFQSYNSEPWYQTLVTVHGFLDSLQPDDYVAITAYDIRPEILQDFTKNKMKAHEALGRLQFPSYSEANLYDAVTDTAERMANIKGRKAIVLVSSGIDTFSKKTLDQTRKSLQKSGVPVHSIGLMQALREWYDSRGYLGSIARLDFLQADNQLRTFSSETGGCAFFPRFYGELPSIFKDIPRMVLATHLLTYQPTNQRRDGATRVVQVDVVDPAIVTSDILNDPKKLKKALNVVIMQDPKNLKKQNKIKLSVGARDEYTAPNK